MQTLVLCQEDFKEETYWVALCDSLGVPNTNKEIVLDVKIIDYY